jgi:uncharacterized membrane protein YfcA
MGILAELPFLTLAAAFAVVALAGFVKGAVGFAMPMLIISGLGSFLPGEVALGALILPTLAANMWQALRQGWRAAWGSVKRFRVFMIVGGVMLLASAQLVRLMPEALFFVILGAFLTLFAMLQLSGWRFRIKESARLRYELGIGAFAGFTGGLSGVWGPPTVAYLTALDTEKRESFRVQGVIYGLGSVLLLAAHLRSGVFNAETAPLSALMLLPAGVGMVLGLAAHDRMDQARFRRVTLVVMVLAGLNLVRRGLMG